MSIYRFRDSVICGFPIDIHVSECMFLAHRIDVGGALRAATGRTDPSPRIARFLQKNRIADLVRLGQFVVLGAAGVLGLAIAGCTTPKANPDRPEEYQVTVQANQFWQPSGIFANQSNVIHCVATGQWSDSFAKYGADGNPDTIKTHLGVSAPANGLLMRIGDQTNMVSFIGKETNVVAGGSGELKFRNNFSLSSGMSGELKVRVTVATDTDGDGISDYEEIHTWKTNPLRVDSDGDGFSDLEESTTGVTAQPLPRNSER